MDEVAEALGQTLIEQLRPVLDKPIVKDIRRLGSWVGIELQDPRTGQTLATGLRGNYDVARHVTRLLLDNGCAAARMSEGLLHVSPPYISTEEDIEFVLETIPVVLDGMEKIVLGRPER